MAGDSTSETAAARRTPGKIHEDQFRLMWAEGAAIRDIAEFATRHGITMTQAQQQWHRHRAGA